MADKTKATYKVRNTSLDEIFKKYEITEVDELLQFSEDKLLDVLKEAGTLAYFEQTKKTKASDENYRGAAGPKYKFVPHISVDRMIAENTVELFMPIDFWRAEHKALARDRDIYERLDKATTGKETMELLTSIKVGISLKPGQEAEVNWTDEFVQEKLKNSPYLKKLSVEKIGGGKVEREAPVDEGKTVSEEKKGVDVHDLDYRTLQQMAKERGIEYVGKPKTELIRKLVDKS